MTIIPYILAGYVYENGTTNGASSNNLILINESTNERISTITNSNGQFIFDLANLRSGYTDSDFIRITGTGGRSTGQNLRFKSVYKGSTQAQIENLDIKYEV